MTQASLRHAGDQQTGLFPGLAVMLVSLCFVIACAVAPAPRDKAVTLIFAPGTSFPDAASRLAPLDARIMRIGVHENIVIVRFFNGWHIADLWRIGAFFPLKTSGLGDCLNSSASSANPATATRSPD